MEPRAHQTRAVGLMAKPEVPGLGPRAAAAHVLAEILRNGDGLEDAARYANAAAALSTLGYGAVAPIPRAAEVRAFLADRG